MRVSSYTSATASGVRAACAVNSAGSVTASLARPAGREVAFHTSRTVSRSLQSKSFISQTRPCGLVRHILKKCFEMIEDLSSGNFINSLAIKIQA